jgi:hypothetical protein
MGIIFFGVTTLLFFTTISVAAVLTAAFAKFRRCGAGVGGADNRTRLKAMPLMIGIIALVLFAGLMSACDVAEQAGAGAQLATQTTADAPATTPLPTQAVLALQPGMSQDTLDLFTELCHDIMYYSNEYCGTQYIVEQEPYHTQDAAKSKLTIFILTGDADPDLTILAFNKCQLVYSELERNPIGDTAELSRRIQDALQGFEDYFGMELIQMQPDGTIDTEKMDDATDQAQPQSGDPLSGKIYVTQGYQDGSMYVEGQAFYFEDGRVYAGLPNDSEAAIKANSLYFTPFDMYYSLEGDTITISGGGSTAYWNYDAAQDVVIAGTTIMTRQ